MTESEKPPGGGFFRHDDAAARQFGARTKATLITGAEQSFEEQHRARKRRYTLLMAFRIPALVAAAAVYGVWGNGLVAVLIVAASIPLPWIAVLIANDRPPRRKDEPSRYAARRAGDRPALEAEHHHTIDG